jgi:hypothetical protein
MADLIRLEQGEVVAISTCSGCGGPVQWKATRHGEKVAMVCGNGHRSAERWGQVCGNRAFVGRIDSQALISRYVAAGSVPLRLDDKKPSKTTQTKVADHDTAKADDTGSTGNDDTGSGGGGIFGSFFS